MQNLHELFENSNVLFQDVPPGTVICGPPFVQDPGDMRTGIRWIDPSDAAEIAKWYARAVWLREPPAPPADPIAVAWVTPDPVEVCADDPAIYVQAQMAPRELYIAPQHHTARTTQITQWAAADGRRTGDDGEPKSDPHQEWLNEGCPPFSFTVWQKFTSEQKNQFTLAELRQVAEDADWLFSSLQDAERFVADDDDYAAPIAPESIGTGWNDPKFLAGAASARPKPNGGGGEASAIAMDRVIMLLTYAEMVALPEGEFLIFGVIVRRAKNVLFGVSNSFKSFMATDMGGSVSTGRSYHGMAVKKCPVIYVANEGANAVGRKRIPAWMAANKIPQDQRGNIYLVNVETILPNETSRNNLLAAIRTIVESGEEFFLIIDVLRGTMKGSDSDDEAAAAWTSAAEILIKEGATMLTVTHSPYSDDGRIRGSSHLWGSFEGRLHAEGDKGKRTAVLMVDRFKDHDSVGQWGFTLDEVEVEEHPGETSLVPRLDGEVKPTKGKSSSIPSAKSKSAKKAREALQEAIDDLGEMPSASDHIPSGVKCVTVDQWRDYFERRYPGTKDAARMAFKRASEALRGDDEIGCWTQHVWLVK
jgi:hypothetical protein